MKRSLSFALLLGALSLAPPAQAGQYTVSTCRNALDGANRSWAFTNNEPRSLSGEDCEPSPSLRTTETLLVRNASAAAAAEWSFVAPAGTRITSLDYNRWARVFSDRGWRAALRTGEGDVLDTCTFAYPQEECEFGSRHGYGRAAFHGLSTSRLSFGARCVPVHWTSCETGGTMHRLEMLVYGARVTVEDDEPPVVAAPQTVLSDGAWHREATSQLVAAASDNTGIRARRVLLDGVERQAESAPGAAAGGCGQLDEGSAYTYTRPCDGPRGLNGVRTTGLDLSRLPEGTHALSVGVTDTGGLEAVSAPVTIRLDRSGPPAPAVVADERWSTAPTGHATWTVPVEHDRAPVVRMETEVCLPSSCRTEVRDGAAPGTALREDTVALPDGETTVRVRLTDAAGNLGAWSAPAVLRRDRQLPRISVGALPASVGAGSALSFTAQGADDRSGIDRVEREYRLNGGGWIALPRTLTAQAGSTYHFRARAVDRAGNATGWVSTGATTVPGNGATAPVSPPPQTPNRPADSAPRRGTIRRPVAVRLTRNAISGGLLRVTGTLMPARSGRISVTFTERSRTMSRSTSARAGRFSLSMRLPRELARARRGVLTVRYAGDDTHASASVRKVLREGRAAR